MRGMQPGPAQPPAPRELTEADITEAAPRTRWLHLQRLERMLKVVEARIEEDEVGGRPLDPRFLEIGLRALAEEAKLLRLHRPAPAAEAEEDDPESVGVDRRMLVAQQLDALEQKMRDAASSGKPAAA